MQLPRFSHVSYASDYMRIAIQLIENHNFSTEIKEIKILDLPAGNGWISDQLAHKGYQAISADINNQRPDFVQVDMENALPFEDHSFDAVICCEGIEHIFSPFHFFSELERVLRPGGILIISTPNIQNLYSRVQFLCTGYLFQFDPFNNPILKKGELADKGHISPVGLTQLIYWSQHLNLTVNPPLGSRYKKRWLLPFLLPLLFLGRFWSYRDWKKTSNDIHTRFITDYMFRVPVLLSRSIIFSAVKH